MFTVSAYIFDWVFGVAVIAAYAGFQLLPGGELFAAILFWLAVIACVWRGVLAAMVAYNIRRVGFWGMGQHIDDNGMGMVQYWLHSPTLLYFAFGVLAGLGFHNPYILVTLPVLSVAPSMMQNTALLKYRKIMNAAMERDD